jgi:glycosyltransferase involved in cell wall biosynthesis
MKVLHLSTSDIEGGAARAAYRLHQGLQQIGVPSEMLVRAKFSGDPAVKAQKNLLTKLGPPLNGLPVQFYSQRDRSTMFSPQWVPDKIRGSVTTLKPDIVNLHWVCNGYLDIKTPAALNRPLVWTLQDMWPFTGGCQYSQDCQGYEEACGHCPQLQSQRAADLSRWVWRRKQRAWKRLNLTIVAPSHWIAECARASSLFGDRRIEVIPFCLDTHKYKPIPKQTARELLNLPQHKQLVLFGALAATKDRRKGFHLLLPALQYLSHSGLQDQIELVVFGSAPPDNPVNLGFPAHYLGHLNDDLSLAIVYAAADVMVVPSLQESFGQTGSEALACGTPVVAFDATGPRDIVDHQQTGYLAKPFDVEDLAQGIAWVLAEPGRHQTLCRQARAKAEQEYPLERQARQYAALYEDILKGSTP